MSRRSWRQLLQIATVLAAALSIAQPLRLQGETADVKPFPPMPLINAEVISPGTPQGSAPQSPQAPQALTPGCPLTNCVLQGPTLYNAPPSAKLQSPDPDTMDRPLPINLATALRLADGRPLLIAAAQANQSVAAAQLARANVLWVPSLNLSGAYYYRHDGGDQLIQSGNIAINSRQDFLGGGGATAIFATTDAIFEPLAARQVLRSRQVDIQTAKNDALLQVAQAYFSVQEARGRYAGMLDSAAKARALVAYVNALGTDLASPIEVNRARTLLAEIEQATATAQQDWRVASADLTRILRLDAAAVVVPLEPDHMQISLVSPQQPVDDMIPIGLTNRPELASQQALVQATLMRIKQERLRPLVPSVLVTGNGTPNGLFNGGYFGTGPNGTMDQWDGRSDVSLQLVWQLENLGFGNRARVRERDGQRQQAIVELFNIQDQVAADVAQTHARLLAAERRAKEAEMGLRQAVISYTGNVRGLGETTRFGDVLQLVIRPQEAVAALTQLQQAYTLYFLTVADYNKAQFRMFHALGYPSQTLAYERPTGSAVPVDMNRPAQFPTCCGPQQ